VNERLLDLEGEITLPMAKSPVSRVYMKQAVVENGKPALTRYRVLEERDSTTLVELRPVTGRNHQLRVHMHALGCTIVGDPLYGQSDDEYIRYVEEKLPKQERLHLHAWKLEGEFNGRPLQLISPPPEFARLAIAISNAG